jgi:hypothetical protein
VFFDTLLDNPGAEPPDDALAVGPSHVLAAGNSSWAVFDKKGSRKFIIPFTDWYGALDTTGNIFDPRADYDARSGRWYLLSIGMDEGKRLSTLQISVSQTSDPLGNWNKYVFSTAETAPDSWMDFPTLGYNDDALFVGGNVFTFGNQGTFQHVTMRIFRKDLMLSGQPVTPTALTDPKGSATTPVFTIQPVTSHDSTKTEWMVEADRNAGNVVRLWNVANPLATAPTLTSTDLTVPKFEIPPGIAQKNNTTALDGGDARIGNAVLRNGEIWAAHGIGDTVNGAKRGKVRVYEIKTTGAGSLAQAYNFEDPVINFYYPSVDLDLFGSVLVGMTAGDVSIFPSVYFAAKAFRDTTFSAPAVLVAGNADYTPKSTENRWGDYSDTHYDPTDSNIVWHQNELGAGGSAFKMTVAAVRTTPESITVLKPNGKEILVAGNDYTITWNSFGFVTPGPVKIELSRDGGATFTEVIAESTEDDGEFVWNVTSPVTDTAQIRISSVGDPRINDVSDRDFRIVEGSLTVTAPNAGDLVTFGSNLAIQWDSTGFATTTSKVKIELSRDGGQTWETLANATDNDGEYLWRAEGPPSDQAVVRVTTLSKVQFSDTSDEFSVRERSTIKVVSPNGNERLVVGDEAEIQWTTTGFDTNVKIELNRNDGSGWQTLFPNAENSGSATWKVTGPPTRAARIRITSVVDPSVSDSSNGLFEIVIPTLTVTAPTSKQRSAVGAPVTIHWATSGLDTNGEVMIEVSRDGGSRWETIAAATENDGTFEWTAGGRPSDAAVVRVTSLERDGVSGVSSRFSISAPTLFLVSPNGGQNWHVGSQATIEWSGSTVGSGTVDIQLSRNGGRSWTTILSGVTNDGAETWGVSGGTTKKALVRVIWNIDPSVQSRSARFFQISARGRSRRR